MLNIVTKIGWIAMEYMITKLAGDKDKRSRALRASVGISDGDIDLEVR